MHDIETRAPRDPQELLNLKKKQLKKRFDVGLMKKTLNVSEEKIIYASKDLPPGIKRSDYFSQERDPETKKLVPFSEKVNHLLRTIKRSPGSLHPKEIATAYNILVKEAGDNSHGACLFIRYARSHFPRK